MISVIALGCDPKNNLRSVTRGDGGSVSMELQADSFAPVAGVPDRTGDPAVLAIDVAGEKLCTGALVASNVLLTARRCVTLADWNACPAPSSSTEVARDPATIAIYGGDDPAQQELLARGLEFVLPDGLSSSERWNFCDGDIALVVLDRDISGLTPLPIRDEAVEKSERIRAVSFGKRREGDPLGKLVREHVAIPDVSSAAFLVAEAACQGDPGGLALDEGTSEILGVMTHAGTRCDGPDVHNLYTRADVHGVLIAEALARAKQRRDEGLDALDAGRPRAKSPKDAKPPTDVGQACQQGADCATALCLKEPSHTYCSRSCGGGDRCPVGYHCKVVTGIQACVMTL
ncbi:MAG TPA: trypsin-like serine protease [Polyangiaceae bacterium]|nr:trypsin-like serine protease [Polyangiaceae bacterium]